VNQEDFVHRISMISVTSVTSTDLPWLVTDDTSTLQLKSSVGVFSGRRSILFPTTSMLSRRSELRFKDFRVFVTVSACAL
jgi:hypothetical protein